MDFQNEQNAETPIPSAIIESQPEPQEFYSQEPTAMPEPRFDYPPPSSSQGSGKGVSIAAMVLGICGLVMLGLAPAIVGLVLAARSLKRNYPGRGMAKAGLVTSIIAIALWVLLIFIIIIGIADFSASRNFYRWPN